MGGQTVRIAFNSSKWDDYFWVYQAMSYCLKPQKFPFYIHVFSYEIHLCSQTEPMLVENKEIGPPLQFKSSRYVAHLIGSMSHV